jgi:hypothetical protein
MLTVDFEELTLELKEGTVKHVGAPRTAATVKCYDVTAVEAREFGDRLKVAVEDDEGNTVEIALDGTEADRLVAELSALREKAE